MPPDPARVLLDGCVTLRPFAAEMRYDYLPPEEGAEEPFDRANALRLVRAALEWAGGFIARDTDEAPQRGS